MKRSILTLVLSTIVLLSISQNKYWLYLSDKNESGFDPYEYFDQLAIERRINQDLPLYDFTDLPVNEEYVSTVNHLCDTVLFASRWFNSIAVTATFEQLSALEQLTFVERIEPMQSYAKLCQTEDFDPEIDYSKKQFLEGQIGHLQGEQFIQNEINGKGIRIAIFDGGFPTVDTNPVFEHIRKDGRLIKTWDFTKNNENVFRSITHGTNVMSCIGGYLDEQHIGLATGAEYMLAKTEIRTEPFSEEHNWLAAMEWADKNGAHIINSSLGYTKHRYFPDEMDGKTSLISRTANLAAKKGILVVNAAGNEGSGKWEYIGAPADADSVLSVGGINPESGFHTSFSSFGPTSDKRMKPNVSAYGHVVAAGKDKLVKTQGTSFSSPLVAGFAACVWQMYPRLTNMEIMAEIEKSGHLHPYFDYAHGFGTPQASYFIKEGADVLPDISFSFEVKAKDLYAIVHIPSDSEDDESLLYYNIQEADGVLSSFYVINVEHDFDIDEVVETEEVNTAKILEQGQMDNGKINKEIFLLSLENLSATSKVNVYYQSFKNSYIRQ